MNRDQEIAEARRRIRACQVGERLPHSVLLGSARFSEWGARREYAYAIGMLFEHAPCHRGDEWIRIE